MPRWFLFLSSFSLSLVLFYGLHDGHCLTLIQAVCRTSFVLITVSRGLFFSFPTLPSVTRSIACVSVSYFLSLFFSFFKPTEDFLFRGLHVINLLLEVQEVRKVCWLANRLAISGHALNYSDNTHKYRKTKTIHTNTEKQRQYTQIQKNKDNTHKYRKTQRENIICIYSFLTNINIYNTMYSI